MDNILKPRSEINDEYKWDLSLIYKSEEEFEKDFKLASALINDFSKFKNTMMNSANNLYETLNSDKEINILLDKLYMYAHLNKDSDTTNQLYQTIYGRVYNLITSYSEISSFIIPTLLEYDYKTIERFYLDNPELKEYNFVFENIYRNKEHILTEKEEKIISSLSQTLAFPESIYDMFTNAELKFSTIKDENNNEVEITDSNFSVFIKSKDRRVRKDAFDTLYDGYSKYKNTISLMLANDVKANTAISKIRKYKSPLEAALFSDNIDIKVYNNLISTVENNLDVLYKYLDLKKKILKLDELHLYDVYAPLLDNSNNKKYSFDEAKTLVKEALSILGDDYSKVLDRAFTEKWIDIYPNIGKVSGAYSSGSYSTNPYILLNYQGELTDVSTLAHELGHSMHSYYSKTNNSYQYSSYKIFVAEVASTVNELLLAKYMLKNSNDNKEKLSILNRMMELFRTTTYRQTMFASFEKSIYEKEQNGEVLTAEVINKLYYDLNKKYFGPNVVIDDKIKYEWEKVPHFYYNFYVYKYATGLAAACHIVNKILSKEENAVSNYIEFLKTGGRDYPIEELKISGVDMNKKEVIESSIKMFDSVIEEFEKLYNDIYKE